MAQTEAGEPLTPSQRIDAHIAALDDWRGATLARMRGLIHEADPEVVEEWKWAKATSPGTPTWSHNGLICTGETYRAVVKFTFAHGAVLDDPAGLFNASLEGNVRRAIDIREGETPDAAAFRALVRAASAHNLARPGVRSRKALPAAVEGTVTPKLLSGGNPQVPKGDGDAPVQAYIAALSGWQQDLVRRIDALIATEVPHVRKGVRWNSPFYGIEGQGWFLSLHIFARYCKVTFFRGVELDPPLAGGKDPEARWVDIHEGRYDEAQMASWVRQAAALPGWGNAQVPARRRRGAG